MCGMREVAALYVKTGGAYYNLPGVHPFDQEKDARTYAGPYPIVAHPPCQRWGKFWAGQPLHIKKTGQRKRKGDDQGCFKSALFDVRRFGGVIEHPADSQAWTHFGLAKPPRSGGWIAADDIGGFTCCIEQGRYGHYARKPTWLYVFGVAKENLPELDWGKSEPKFPPEAIEKHGLDYCKRAGELAFQGGGENSTPRINTPEAFRDILIQIARMASTQQPGLFE